MITDNIDPEEVAKFDQLATQWWDKDGELKTLHDINPIRLQYIQNYIDLQNVDALDVGCGGGILTESLAQCQAHVTAIDVSENTIQVAQAHAEKMNLDIDYQCTPIEALASEQGKKYDVITCLEMLEHVPKPQNIIHTCAKLIKPGGHIFFSTLNRTFKSFLLAIVSAEYILKLLPRGTHEYAKLIRPAELAAWLRTNNLELDDIKGIHYNPLLRTARLTNRLAVNYIAHCVPVDSL